MQNNTPRTGPTNLGELFRAALDPINKAQQKKKRSQFKPDYARLKLKFFYRDGNHSVHYSYDFIYRYENGAKTKVSDEELGYVKLLKLIQKQREADTFITAVIWANVSDNLSTDSGRYDYEIVKAVRGKEPVLNKAVRFHKGKLDINAVKNYSR